MVIIRWHGHACFEIVPSSGITIVIDPHDGASIGIKPPQVKADIVLITHEHFDHNAYRVVSKDKSEVISSREGEFEVQGVRIKGITAYHDPYKGRRRGSVVMYKIMVDDLEILHMGDVGHILTSEQVNEVGQVDVVMIPVGGTFTIGPEEAWRTLEVLRPRVAIPMHYWISGINLPLMPVDEFVSKASEEWEIVYHDTNQIELSKNALPKKLTVYVLRPP